MELSEAAFDIRRYHEILCKEPPAFINQYAQLYLIQRLKGVGLLCGTDWTPLYKNSFYYSRYDHSIGTALIVWNFTHDKKQTLAALLHDVSTQSFSHVNDFRKGDTINQEASELINAQMIVQDVELGAKLNQEGLYSTEVKDSSKYPVAENKLPRLCADRLEYMYPSGAAFDGTWTIEEIEKNYNAISLFTNEDNKPELGFVSEEEALIYVKKFCSISLILQHNENKLTLQLLADIVKKAIETELITEDDLFKMNEEQLMERFTFAVEEEADEEFVRLFTTFREMKSIVHSDTPMENAYNVCLDVKQRYVDPLVLTNVSSGTIERLSEINEEAKKIIQDFLAFKDTKYGCVPYC